MSEGMAGRGSLFIDKISFTLPALNSTTQHHIIDQLQAATFAGDIESIPFSELLKNYLSAWTLPLRNGSRMTIQAMPRRRSSNFLRVEFNPRRASWYGVEPMVELARILAPAFTDFAECLIHANVTRIDFAVDLLNVPIEELLIFHTTHATKSRVFEANGKVTGYYVGSRESNRYAVMYDKIAQLRSQGSAAPRGIRTRLELRCANVGSFTTIASMSNPFDAFQLARIGGTRNQDWTWPLFLDSCRFRGAQAALTQITDKQKRAAYRQALILENRPVWWQPEELWNERGHAINRLLSLVEQE